MTTTQQFSPGIERILQHMRQTVGWLVYDGQIRRNIPYSESCPLTSPCGESTGMWRSCARQNALTNLDAVRVMLTADGHTDSEWFNSELRAVMLETGRIEEVAS